MSASENKDAIKAAFVVFSQGYLSMQDEPSFFFLLIIFISCFNSS